MSNWEYRAGRKIVLENIVKGDFSNVTEPRTEIERQKLIEDAKRILKEEYQ